MRPAKINRMDPSVPFLSNKVKGTVLCEIPDGLQSSEGEWLEQEEATVIQPRMSGASSGHGKKNSVV